MDANEQQMQAINSNSNKLLVMAGAGAGKTFVMIQRVTRLVKEGVSPNSILVLTFTNNAAFEMRERYKNLNPGTIIPEFRTFHSFCYSLIVKDPLVREAIGYKTVPKVANDDELKFIEKNARMQTNFKIPEKKVKQGLQTLGEKKAYEIYQKAFVRLLKQKNLITFDILCYDICDLFVKNHPIVDRYKHQYQYLFVDEFQDTDPRQIQFLNSFKDVNWFYCGDALQCQPAGTQVMMLDGSYKPIEDLEMGEYVTSYNPKEASYSHKTKNQWKTAIIAKEHHHADNIVKISSANHSSKYTKDHITYARIHYEGNQDKQVIYLAHNRTLGWWRVGQTQLFLANSIDFGVRSRLTSEQGDEAWILDIVDSPREAWRIEQICAYRYGIPQTTWSDECMRRGTFEDLVYLYDNLPDLDQKAEELLRAFGRDIKYPFVIRGRKHIHYSKLHCFEIEVGNLIPGLFDIVIPDYRYEGYKYKDKEYSYARLHNTYEQITSIEPCEPEEVYSIAVERNHTYVSDGILTHNCIYHFRGTDNTFLKMLADDDSWERIKMYQNYRSTKEICEFANKHSRYADDSYRIEMNGQRNGDQVEIITGSMANYDEPVDFIHLKKIVAMAKDRKEDMAIICRTNKEVSAICNALTAEGIEYNASHKHADAFHILRSVMDNEYMLNWLSTFLSADLYADYVRQSMNIPNPDIDWFSRIYGRQKMIQKYGRKIVAIRKILQNIRMSEYEKCCQILSDLEIDCIEVENTVAYASKSELIEDLIERLNNATSEDLYVGTIHSVKGLEFGHVIVVGAFDTNFKIDSEENKNIYYVAITRAKNHLTVFMR